MKKIFIVLAIVGFGFTACNNAAENQATDDTTVAPLSIDTTTVSPLTPADSAAAAEIDSTIAAKIDSATKN